jgi:hypothetical protein
MTAGVDPGRVWIRLSAERGRVSAVHVASERPAVARSLCGKPADDAVRLVPLLFALCGKAQGRAADLALAAARGQPCPVRLDPAIEQEVMREHLWRWLLDLPSLLGEASLREEFVAAVAWVAQFRRDELAALLAGPRIEALCSRLGTMEDVVVPQQRLLPALDAEASLACWTTLDAGFCRLPEWQGAAAETGALSRQQGRAGLPGTAFAARWLARLEELRNWAHDLAIVGAGGTASAVPVAPGSGRALVETARGLLMHEIVLDGDRIAGYSIVAPTEWNFHPQGSLVNWLMGRDAGDREALRNFVAHGVAALDPCVRWDLQGI